MAESAQVAIVGGGITGTAIAFFLARRGCRDVILLERSNLGAGSTGAAAGGIRAQFSTEINVRCSLLSAPFWHRFAEETGMPHPFAATGYLLLATTASEHDALREGVALQNRLGVASRLLSPAELSGIVPILHVADLAGGAFCAEDGVGSPWDAMQGFAKAAKAQGVRVREHARVAAIETTNGRVNAVRLVDGERITVEAVVNAAGPWSAEIGALVGLDVPVHPFRRELYVSEPFPELAQGPLVIDLHTGWYFRREGDRVLMAGNADRFSSWNTSVDWSELPSVATRAVHRVPALERAAFTNAWAGSYDISPDNHALLGEFPELRGFICACGFSGHGYMHSPATGLLVSELILDGRATSLAIDELAPDRFRNGRAIVERLTTHGELHAQESA